MGDKDFFSLVATHILAVKSIAHGEPLLDSPQTLSIDMMWLEDAACALGCFSTIHPCYDKLYFHFFIYKTW